MNAQISSTQTSRPVVRVIRLIPRPRPGPSARGDEIARVTPFIRLDPDAEPGRGRLGHCY